MGKNNNKPAKATTTPKKPIEAPKSTTEEAKTQKPVQVLDLSMFGEGANLIAQNNAAGLDPNHREDLLHLMHEVFGKDPAAAEKYHMDVKTVSNINELTARGIIAAFACEVVYAKNPFAVSLNKQSLQLVQEIGKEVGLTVNPKYLPSPNEDGTIEIPSEAFEVSKEAKEEIVKDQEAVEKEGVELDPTKITSDEMLKEALLHILADRTNNWRKISEAVNFMRSYLSVQAKKSEDKEKELERIKAMTASELVSKISDVVDRCPFVLNQIGRSMTTFTSHTKSPISAFCMFRDSAKNKETGKPAASDSELAEYVKAIITWSIKISKERTLAEIATRENDIKLLNKDAKKNAKGIEEANKKIKELKANLEHYNDTLSYVVTPTGDVADDLLTNMTSEDDTVKANASRIFNAISRSYYDNIDLSKCKADDVKFNIKQYAGIITNLFRSADTPILTYSEGNLVSLEPVSSEDENKGDESKK